jgi:hypothetical protein
MKIVIGKSGGKNVSIDIERLLATRLLIQANSGKGKSWLIRLLAEQLFGKIPVIILDPEGEFATLREKYGYVLVGKGGETPADTRSAAMVAHTLLQLKASAVCDLYEMKPSQRHAWVAAFLDALIDAPKELWHPVIVIVDEAHVFCPEKGAGESEASEAMISLATRGRKRGFCAVFATQRLGKLRKDAAAELVNVLIGGTFIDVDRKRAADTLGVYGKDTHKFFDEVKMLEKGYFFALGPAISQERILVKVGDVETTHPEAGSAKHADGPPPAPSAIAKMLPKLADLPKQAEEQAKTVAEFKAEIRSLKARLRAQPAGKPVEVKVADPRAVQRAVIPLKKMLEEAMRVMVKIQAVGFDSAAVKPEEISKALEATAKEISRLAKAGLEKRSAEFERLKRETSSLMSRMVKLLGEEDLTVNVKVERNEPFTVKGPAPTEPAGDGRPLKAGARKMLEVLAQWHPDARTREQLGVLAGFAPTGGTFSEYMSALRSGGYIHENGDGVHITEAGMSTLPTVPVRPDSPEAMVSYWKSKFKAGVGKMLDVLVEEYPGMITREELGQRSGFAASGGTFSEYFSALRRARLIEERGGSFRASESLMEV